MLLAPYEIRSLIFVAYIVMSMAFPIHTNLVESSRKINNVDPAMRLTESSTYCNHDYGTSNPHMFQDLCPHLAHMLL